MDYTQIFQAFVALIFVLGLLLITLWLIKFCQRKGACSHLGKCFSGHAGIKIIEQRRLDIKNTLAVVEYDSAEYFLLLGSAANLLLNRTPVNKKDASDD